MARCIYARTEVSGNGKSTLWLGAIWDGVMFDLQDILGAEGVTVTNIPSTDQEIWKFQIGDPDADVFTNYDQHHWRWRVWRNEGNPLIDVVVNPESWQAGVEDMITTGDYDYCSLGMTAASFFSVIFGLPQHVNPVKVESVAYSVPAAS